MPRKRKKVIPVEHLVNELKASQSGTHLNNYNYNGTQSEKQIWMNLKDIHNDKVLDRKVQNNTSAGNSIKRKISESSNGKKGRAAEKSSSKHKHTDFKVRHCYSSDFKNYGHTRNVKVNVKGNSKSLSSSNLPVNHTEENSLNSGSENTLKISNTCQEINHNKIQSQTLGLESKGNSSKRNGLNLEKLSTPKRSARADQRIAVPEFSKCQDETIELEPKSKEVTSTMEQNHFNKRSFEPTPGPSGHRNISDLVINRIKSDKKFQANVKTVIAKCNANVNRSLIDENQYNLLEDEEMDWEPSDQIVMIEHIKSIRKNLDTATSLSCGLALHENNFLQRLKDNVLLVVDTNIFISCLSFIRDVRDTYLPELGLPIIFIPWVVLRELDHLKGAGAHQLAKSAVRAIRYINETLLSKHPRVSGQSFEDFCSMKNAACDCTDDEILNTCINVKAVDKRRRVMLITNDKNLESKAIVSGIEAYSIHRFQENVMNKINTGQNIGNCQDDQNLIAVKYTLYPKLKNILKIALEKVVEFELKKAFGEDWLRIVIRKPPWNLIHVFECFLKHWRSVFTFTFKKSLETIIQDVKKKFLSEDNVPGKGAKFSNLVQVSVELLESVRHQIHLNASSSPKYFKLLEHLSTALHEIELLRQAGKLSEEQSSDVQMSASSIPIDTEDVPIVEVPVSNNQIRKEEVKALFQIIWNQVQSFCLRVNELVSNYGIDDSEVVDPIKCQFPQVMQKLQELIERIEKIVSMEPKEIAQSSQLIMDFTNFLISLNVIQTDSLNVETLLKNIEFFCCDDESRGILRVLINDLKQFGTQIVDGMSHLGSRVKKLTRQGIDGAEFNK